MRINGQPLDKDKFVKYFWQVMDKLEATLVSKRQNFIPRDKVCGCFKNSISIVLQQFQSKVSFQREGPSVALKLLPNL